MTESTGDVAVDAALADIARTAPDIASAARAGYQSLTWGEGLASVTAHGLADFLWFQLPLKWMCDLAEKRRIAAALGELFARLERPRYAAMCVSPATVEILTAYEHTEAAGLKAYRSALAASGVQPPDVPGSLSWGTVMGADEAAAYRSASRRLEEAITSGTLRPGAPGWRRAAQQITSDLLDSQHDDVTGTTWLQWLHAERLQQWSQARGPTRGALAGDIADLLTNPLPVPAMAADSLAPMRWLLDHAETGIPLTRTGNLARAVVTEGCRRFGWLTGSANPRSESDVIELWGLRELAKQMGVVRRSGGALMLSAAGRTIQAGGTGQLWFATMDCLLPAGEAAGAAGEIALLLLISTGYAGRALERRPAGVAIAAALAEEGWHSQRTGAAITPDRLAPLLADLRLRIDLLQLGVVGDLGRVRAGELPELNETGQHAAHTALRARALRPRRQPVS